MAVYLSKNLKKKSIEIDKNGNIINSNSFENKEDEMRQKQIERAKKLGFL